MKKRTMLALLMVFALALPAACANEESMTLYALDGRSAVVVKTDVEAWKSVGWYDYIPSVTLYAPDGRQESVAVWNVDAWKNVGWLDAQGYNALMQANKAYPFFSLESDYYIGSIRMGMKYSDFIAAYGGSVISESQIEEGMDDYFFTVELDGAYLNFSNYYSRYDKNNFTLNYFYTASDKWSFARGIKVGESIENVYSRLPYTGYYNDGDTVGRYVFDTSLRKLDKLAPGKEIYALTVSNPYISLFRGYYRSDGFGGLMKLTERNGYIASVEMYC